VLSSQPYLAGSRDCPSFPKVPCVLAKLLRKPEFVPSPQTPRARDDQWASLCNIVAAHSTRRGLSNIVHQRMHFRSVCCRLLCLCNRSDFPLRPRSDIIFSFINHHPCLHVTTASLQVTPTTPTTVLLRRHLPPFHVPIFYNISPAVAGFTCPQSIFPL
jgi:hypothetical protein